MNKTTNLNGIPLNTGASRNCTSRRNTFGYRILSCITSEFFLLSITSFYSENRRFDILKRFRCILSLFSLFQPIIIYPITICIIFFRRTRFREFSSRKLNAFLKIDINEKLLFKNNNISHSNQLKMWSI